MCTVLNIDNLNITNQELKKEVIQKLKSYKIKMLIKYNNRIVKGKIIKKYNLINLKYYELTVAKVLYY